MWFTGLTLIETLNLQLWDCKPDLLTAFSWLVTSTLGSTTFNRWIIAAGICTKKEANERGNVYCSEQSNISDLCFHN